MSDLLTPEKELTLSDLIKLINLYVNAIDACQYQIMLFPNSYDDIIKELEDYANKYIDTIEKYLVQYEKDKASSNVVNLAYTKYYKELKKHKARGWSL